MKASESLGTLVQSVLAIPISRTRAPFSRQLLTQLPANSCPGRQHMHGSLPPTLRPTLISWVRWAFWLLRPHLKSISLSLFSVFVK